jgi:hypothetical protein
MTLPRFPFSVGDVVSGHDCMNAPFTGTVTKLVGPYTVILDNHVYTPISLIDTPPTNAEDADVFG